ncbi:MAG: hypothetical protein KAI71_05430 [Candidatus Pacebacteria bacterium]|nr:hypothetical protein [Candidatus Paceibacterota bacterium]
MIEKEFKYLVNLQNIPKKVFGCDFVDIEQGYISDVCDLDTEMRVRIETQSGQKRYILAIKKETGTKGERIEAEIELSEEDFKEIWILTEGKRLWKRRYLIPYELSDKRTIFMELDVFQGDLIGYVTLEIEEKRKDDLKSFVPPVWIGENVTGDKKYSNKNLVFCKLEVICYEEI